MVDPNGTRAEVLRLMKSRDAIEAEISECSERLSARGVPASEGLHAPLVDAEGFPRPDALEIRSDRHKIAVLSNDHKAVSAQIEQLLHTLHAGAAASRAPLAQQSQQASALPPQAKAQARQLVGAAPAAEPADGSFSRPFAVVDDVSADSPASAAGVQIGDQLWRFGSVSAAADGGSSLQAVAAELQAREGQPTEALFWRQGAPLTLVLTPQRWAGRGLLGCHLRPV